MSKTARLLSITSVAVLVLSACNLPSGEVETPNPNIVFTAAAQTVEARLTQSAPLFTPTSPLPLPTNTSVPPPTLPLPPTAIPPTSAPTQVCDKAQFITDVTVPDGTEFSPGATFTKTWRLKNIGTCSWTPSYATIYASGEQMSGPASQALIGNVDPGQTVDISVALKAPSTPGTYTGYWKLRNAAGVLFATFYVQVKVPGGGGPFAVTSVSFTTAGGCGSFTATANITTNGAGSVTYHWVWSDGAIDTEVHAPLVYSAAGTQSASTSWSTANPGSKWIDIYIDSPNHQQFGRASFSCP